MWDIRHEAPQQSLETARVLMQATKCLVYLLGSGFNKLKKAKLFRDVFLKSRKIEMNVQS